MFSHQIASSAGHLIPKNIGSLLSQDIFYCYRYVIGSQVLLIDLGSFKANNADEDGASGWSAAQVMS